MIVTHDSHTFLPASKWWMNLGRFMAQCQNKNFEEQLKLGSVGFDLRVRRDSKGNSVFAHGFFEFKGLTPEAAIQQIQELSIKYDRIITIGFNLEERYNDHSDSQEEWFKEWCKSIEKYQSDRLFINGGNRVRDWKPLYQFKNPNPNNAEYHTNNGQTIFGFSSKHGAWAVWPWLYSKLHNKEIIKEYNDNPNVHLMIDHIGTGGKLVTPF